ncbi:hypothetical protein PRIPAC_97578 [Pristionchus pacificus]|uniref:Uncharacterized protein n=1 Tax=Pristionchus pacificus TaxID=54126 RepID=A0A2A6D2L6_PRIPA|nr:hypothetical protein PRIPAC_97578 [Pristionchus pacificus]|eukprot:PDM84630.1 hypothetical protein PRIPAC_33653 [Pristionchus pacificus]
MGKEEQKEENPHGAATNERERKRRASSVDFTFSTLYDFQDFAEKREKTIDDHFDTRSPKNRTNRAGFGTVKKCRFSQTLLIGVLEGAEDAGHIHFLCRFPVCSRRRHVEMRIQRPKLPRVTKTRKIRASLNREKPKNYKKDAFRRDVVWSKQEIDIKNEYAQRLQHPREPQLAIHLANECEYDVYDSLNMKGVTIKHNYSSTIMSAAPFNLVATNSGVRNGLTARLTGFDNIMDDVGEVCPQAFRINTEENFPGFNLHIAGPIISILFDLRNEVKVEANTQFNSEFGIPIFDLAEDGFITSGGYNGCKKPNSGKLLFHYLTFDFLCGVQSFRSNLLLNTSSYLLTSNDFRNVTIDIEPNMDTQHTVIVNDITNASPQTITVKNRIMIDFSKTQSNTSYSQNVEIAFTGLSGDQGFLMRYTTTVSEKATTTTEKPTSGSSEIKTTTVQTTNTSATLLSSAACFAAARML